MSKIKQINIAKDFSEFPWARYRIDGEHSGEEFFDEILNKINVDELDEIIINLDGTYWYPSSFLSQAFWTFYKTYWKEWWDKLKFISHEDSSLPGFISRLIKQNAQ